MRWLILLILLLVGCSSSNKVGMGRLEVPTIADEQYGQQVLSELARSYKLSRDDGLVTRVRGVADRIIRATTTRYIPWHLYVFEAPTVFNAAATRGNHLFVWSGVLDSITSDAELAVLLAHEIGHLMAGHTDQDPKLQSKVILSSTLGRAASAAASITPNIAFGADIIGAIVGSVSEALIVKTDLRSREEEADRIGLFLMADAGYDPKIAVDFWERMQLTDQSLFGSFFSTHPTANERLAALRALLPEATARVALHTKPIVPSFVPEGFKIVKIRELPVYSAPDRDSPVVDVLPYGTAILIQPGDTGSAWLEVAKPVQGWIEGKAMAK